MKKIHSFFLLLMGMLLSSVYAQALQTPVAGAQYTVVHSSNYVLSSASANAKIVSPTGGDDQKFEFVPVDGQAGVYNIKSIALGKYLGLDKADGYTSVWADDASSALAQFTIELVNATEIKFKNVTTGKYIGTDANAANSGVYTDKSGSDGKHYWFLMDASANLAQQFLQETIDASKEFVAGITAGPEVGEYPQEAVNTIQSAISAAEAALSGSTDELVAARETLNTAMNVFKGERIAFKIDPNASYYIMHAPASAFLGNTANSVVLTAPSGAETQRFKLVAVEGEKAVYNIQLVSGEYLTKSGSWSLVWGTDANANVAKYKIELMADEHLAFKCLDNNAYVGTDATAVGEGVYSNKGSGAENSHWIIVEYDPNQLLTAYLEIVIAQAQKLIDNSPVGDKGHQWPQSAVDELAAAVAVAQGVLTNATAQADVNAAADVLSAAITTFNAAKITPMLNPAEGDKFRYAVGKYATKFLNYNGTDAKTTAERVVNGESQLWEFVKVAGTTNKFIMKQGDLAFDATDGATMSAFNAETSAQITLTYNKTENGVDYYGLTREDGKVLTFSSGNTAAWQAYVTTNNAHYGIITRANLPHDPTMGTLVTNTASARTLVASKTYGVGEGLWPIFYGDSLTTVINKAQLILDGSGSTQTEVDAMVTELAGTVKWFNEPPKADYTALEAAIAEAEAAKAAAVVGNKAGQYYQSTIDAFVSGPIAAGKNGLKLSVQDDVDAAAVAMAAATVAFKAAAHTADVGVEQVLAEAITAAKALLAAAQVGIEKGQYPQAVKDAFQAAITAAEVAPATDAKLENLQEAEAIFKAGVMAIDRAPLKSQITTAKAKILDTVTGACDGQIAEIYKTNLQSTIDGAEGFYNDPASTQEKIDRALATLKTAVEGFNSGIVKIDFSLLKAAIKEAETTITTLTPEKGEGAGTYPSTAFETLQGEITIAKAVDGSKTVIQSDVTAATAKMKSATLDLVTSRVPNYYRALNNKIKEANLYLDWTPVGTEAGHTTQAALNTLESAIATAEALCNSTKQLDIDNGVIRLNKELAIFKGTIVEADVTALNAMITAARAAISKNGITTGDEYEELIWQLEEAEAYVEEPIETQPDTDQRTSDLRVALDAYNALTGVDEIAIAEVSVYAVDGTLYVKGLPEGAVVSVYTTGGVLVSNATGDATLNLSPATYIVKMQLNGAEKSIQVIVE